MEPGEASTVAGEVTNFLNNLLPKKKFPVPSVLFRVEPQHLSDIHATAKSVYPDCFAGAKIAILRDIGGKFKLSQQYDYRYKKVANRSFAHFLHKEMARKADGSEVLVDLRGSAAATYSEDRDDGLSVKVASRIKDFTSSEVEMTIGRAAGDGCGSVSFSAEDVDPRSFKIVAQYLHGVSENFSVGGEMAASPLSSSARPEVTLSARYCPPGGSVSMTVGRNAFQICFYKALSSSLRLASVVDCGNYGDRTTFSLAVQNNVTEHSRLKTFVDSNRTGGFNFEKDVYLREPNSDFKVLRIVASMLMDRQRRVEFGLGFFVDL